MSTIYTGVPDSWELGYFCRSQTGLDGEIVELPPRYALRKFDSEKAQLIWISESFVEDGCLDKEVWELVKGMLNDNN